MLLIVAEMRFCKSQRQMHTAKANAHRQECLCYSFVAQRDDWVYVGGAASWDVARGQGYADQHGGYGDECYGVGRLYAEEEARHQARQG